MTSLTYLSLQDVADRLGLSRNTIGNYATQGRLPEPDVIVGQRQRVRGWLPETIDQWNTQRPGTRRHD